MYNHSRYNCWNRLLILFTMAFIRIVLCANFLNALANFKENVKHRLEMSWSSQDWPRIDWVFFFYFKMKIGENGHLNKYVFHVVFGTPHPFLYLDRISLLTLSSVCCNPSIVWKSDTQT